MILLTDLSVIDKNFDVKTTLNRNNLKYYSVDSKPFRVYGVYKDGGMYKRIPTDVAKSVNDGVVVLHTNTAGGRVRFATDSPFVAIYAKLNGIVRRPHFSLSGSAGFDLYADNTYIKTFMPPYEMADGYESIIDIGGFSMREININFPSYTGVNELYIGLHENAKVTEPKPYKNTLPVVDYGSSITQGACSSRPGMTYQEIVSRELDLDYVNLGFSGSARAEETMSDYICSLDMSVFVYDYDHNAPNVEHLAATHEKMFKKIRASHPTLPIIMMSRPKYYLDEDEKKRREIVEATYNRARLAGDDNVYFLDGKALSELCKNEGLVDGCHPTDFGFASMASALIPVIQKCMKW